MTEPTNVNVTSIIIPSARRTMAGAKPELRPRVFQNQARDLLRHVRKGQADHAEVVDALWSMAREHGLLELLGQDKVQAIVSGAEDDPKPAPPPEANGAWPGMFEQPGDPGPAAPSETPHGPPQPLAPWWRDPATIPPRRYLFGGHYVRLAVGVTIGAGGRAKTTLGCCEAVGMAVGRDLMIDKPLPDGPLRVWMLNSEEDQDELDRRISAVCQRYEISEADLGGRLYAQSVRDKPMRIAAMVGGVPMLDANVVQQMTAFAKENRIDVVMADPLVSFHSVPENDNGAMDIVIKGGFGSIANQANAAVELFHHPGKPKHGQVNTVVEDGRGASSVLWAVRSARVLNFMTPGEAGKLGIPEDERRMHVRIANGKANMGPLGKAEWMCLKIENLPNGDRVATASHWAPLDPFENITSAHMELAKQLAASGEYRADSRSPKWFGYALAEQLDVAVSYKAKNDPKDLARLHAIIKIWLKNNDLEIERRKDEDGKNRQFIISGAFRSAHKRQAIRQLRR